MIFIKSLSSKQSIDAIVVLFYTYASRGACVPFENRHIRVHRNRRCNNIVINICISIYQYPLNRICGIIYRIL